jgi:hypothetical protein
MKMAIRLIGVAGLLLIVGCQAKTETGYTPRMLGDGESVRKGYYASPYSPAAREAEAAQDKDNIDRRPAPNP